MKSYTIIISCQEQLRDLWKDVFPTRFENASWSTKVVSETEAVQTILQANQIVHCLIEILPKGVKFIDRPAEHRFADSTTGMLIIQIQQDNQDYLIFNLLTRQMCVRKGDAWRQEMAKLICIMTIDQVRRQQAERQESQKPRLPRVATQ
jgi:hypothetical protein